MYPLIRDGDWIEVIPVSIGEIRIGDVIFFRSGSHLFAHRVTRRLDGDGGIHLSTRGDRHLLGERPVDLGTDLIGRVQTVYRGRRVIRLDRGLSGFLGQLIVRSRTAHLCVWGLGRIWSRCTRLVQELVPFRTGFRDEPRASRSKET